MKKPCAFDLIQLWDWKGHSSLSLRTLMSAVLCKTALPSTTWMPIDFYLVAFSSVFSTKLSLASISINKLSGYVICFPFVTLADTYLVSPSNLVFWAPKLFLFFSQLNYYLLVSIFSLSTESLLLWDESHHIWIDKDRHFMKNAKMAWYAKGFFLVKYKKKNSIIHLVSFSGVTLVAFAWK